MAQVTQFKISPDAVTDNFVQQSLSVVTNPQTHADNLPLRMVSWNVLCAARAEQIASAKRALADQGAAQ